MNPAARLLAVVILLALLAACGENSPSQVALDDAPTATGSPSEAQTSTAEPTSSADPTAGPEPTPSGAEDGDADQGTPPTDGEPSASSGGAMLGDWYLIEAEGLEGLPLPDRDITMTVEADRLAGHGGCNSFTAGYSLDGDALSVGPVAATKMACEPPELMRAEQTLLAALESATRMALDGDELVIEAEGATLRFASLMVPDDPASDGAGGGLPGAPTDN